MPLARELLGLEDLDDLPALLDRFATDFEPTNATAFYRAFPLLNELLLPGATSTSDGSSPW